jgi:hypothetical protein
LPCTSVYTTEEVSILQNPDYGLRFE